MMGAGAAENVRWLDQAAAASTGNRDRRRAGAAAVEAAHAGVIPPPVIEANRDLLTALVASNFLGVNSGAIAACVAEYDQMWAQDASVMYGFSADAAAVTGALVPFTPLEPTVNPGGVAGQAAAVAQAGGTAAGQAGQQAATAGQSVANSTPASASEASSILTMAPQFLGSVPQVLQGLSQPLMSGAGNPMQSLSGFGSLLSPFLGMMSNPGMAGLGSLGATGAAPAAIGSRGKCRRRVRRRRSRSAMSAAIGRAGSLGGLSVPATWAASTQPSSGSAAPVSAGVGANPGSAPATTGAGGVGGARHRWRRWPAAQAGAGEGPSYGAPVRVLPRGPGNDGPAGVNGEELKTPFIRISWRIAPRAAQTTRLTRIQQTGIHRYRDEE